MVLQNAYKTLMDIGGLETEAEYGYDGEDEACKFNRSKVSFFHLLIFARSTNPMFFLSSVLQVLQVDSGIFSLFFFITFSTGRRLRSGSAEASRSLRTRRRWQSGFSRTDQSASHSTPLPCSSTWEG